MCPAGRIAERSFRDMPITFGRSRCARFISSPSVLTSRRRGDAPAVADPPRGRTESSETLVTFLPDSRSYQSLPTIPLMLGVAPVSMVECPIAVTVG